MRTKLAKRKRKWVILGTFGFVSGLVTLLVFRSVSMASGTAVMAMVAVIAIKHLALALVVGSPLAALFRSLRPTLKAHCPFSSSSGG